MGLRLVGVLVKVIDRESVGQTDVPKDKPRDYGIELAFFTTSNCSNVRSVVGVGKRCDVSDEQLLEDILAAEKQRAAKGLYTHTKDFIKRQIQQYPKLVLS